ncbi:MAG: helix-turn-helix transcriptional regulator [Bacteroidales bacterium]|jgi:lambda repressor-like predicted transcriptional regulator|nr:helix-turn-helix transcriptional regulator [Bacteroidales bacterium]
MDTTENIHIGELIKQVLEEQGRTITWLAKQIGCSRENLYKIFRRSWIHTDMLQKISIALGYDFFNIYTEWYDQQKNQ